MLAGCIDLGHGNLKTMHIVCGAPDKDSPKGELVFSRPRFVDSPEFGTFSGRARRFLWHPQKKKSCLCPEAHASSELNLRKILRCRFSSKRWIKVWRWSNPHQSVIYRMEAKQSCSRECALKLPWILRLVLKKETCWGQKVMQWLQEHIPFPWVPVFQLSIQSLAQIQIHDSVWPSNLHPHS